MHMKVCNSDPLSHTCVKCEPARVCSVWPRSYTDTQSPKHTWSLTWPFLTIRPLPDNGHGSVTPIHLSIVHQVSTPEIQGQWERCLLTQPLQEPLENNKASVEWNAEQKHWVQYFTVRQGGQEGLLLLYGPYSTGRLIYSVKSQVNRLQNQVQICPNSLEMFGYDKIRVHALILSQ